MRTVSATTARFAAVLGSAFARVERLERMGERHDERRDTTGADRDDSRQALRSETSDG